MKKTFKILLSLTICVISLLSLGITAFAAMPEDDTVRPLYDNIISAAVNITFSDGTGNALATVRRASGTTSMNGTLKVYDSNGSLVASASNQTTRATLLISVDFDATVGETYTVILSAIAIKSGVGETIGESHTLTYTA